MSTTLHHLLTLFLLTQSRTTNIPLFLLFQALYALMGSKSLGLGSLEISITTLLLQFAGFFAMGGNNAISGVDLSSAYNGISDFNVVAVGVLILVSNWAASVWWMSAGNLMLLASRAPTPANAAIRNESGNTTKVGERSHRQEAAGSRSCESSDGQWEVWKQHVGLLTVFTAASLVAVMAACTALRTHLFIWTVFSPKYLYSMAWSLGMHLGVNVALGGLLFWLGSSR